MMFHVTVATTIKKVVGFAHKDSLRPVHSPASFRYLLERERARTDRTGDKFSMISFLPREGEREPVARHLVKVLQQRLRTTDDVGRLDDQQLAVLLPFTDGPGAWTLADAVCLLFPDDLTLPVCTVYTYPSSGSHVSTQYGGIDTENMDKAVTPLEMFFLRRVPLWKRFLDVSLAGVALVLLAPLFLIIALAIKLTGRGPVFFRQQRSGRGGKPFTMYKFRSMVVNAEALQKDLLHISEQDGPAFKLKKDPRLTAVGRFLRMTSLDELPQLWNVLRGDMTLVGPRPLPVAETEGCAVWQRRRLDVTPGLTCIWQVRGRSQVPFAEWIRMDIEYIASFSLFQDLKLLFLTVPAVLMRRGAH
jgi:lipopolysaccharide/colanic/teichoic acid biosynthesis glycosyltransferase